VKRAAFLALLFWASPAAAESRMPESVHDFTMTTIDGEERPLSVYSGKALLVVNVASKCGFTPQYASLQKLYSNYKDRGFEILAFPSNDFMGQEPGSDAEIKEFCSMNYGATFPLFAKIKVKGKGAHPFYKFLTEGSGHDGPIGWNFNKFLIAPDGKVVARYGATTDPLSTELVSKLESVLASR